jgi:hypothetical protein
MVYRWRTYRIFLIITNLDNTLISGVSHLSYQLNLNHGKDEVISSTLIEGSSEIKASEVPTSEVFVFLLLPYYYLTTTLLLPEYNEISS